MRAKADEDWRLTFALTRGGNPELLLAELRSRLHDKVVLTNDEDRVFAYAMGENALAQAREEIGRAVDATAIVVSHWERHQRFWRQMDPPISDAEADAQQRAAAAARRAERQAAPGDRVTGSVACVVGRLMRKTFEGDAESHASDLGLVCEIVEHPHLLSTQIAFNVTGTASSVEAFERYLRDTASSSVRLDLGLLLWGPP